MLRKLLLLSFVFATFSAFNTILAASGDLDRSFGLGGIVVTGSSFVARTLAVQADDKILAGGQCFQAGFGSHFCITRFNKNGDLDTTFGNNASVFTQINVPVGTEGSLIVKIIVLPDGKILAAGYTDRNGVGGSRYSQFAIVRYLPDGNIDTSFANAGKFVDRIVVNELGIRLIDVALQPDGKIVAVAGDPYAGPDDVALIRLNADGSYDPSFANGGRLITTWGNSVPQTMSLQPDGKILVGGGTNSAAQGSYRITRYLANGSVDSGSANNFTIPVGVSNPKVRKLETLLDGKILMLGSSTHLGFSSIFLARINPNFTFDTTFNGTGRLTTSFTPDQNCDPMDFHLKPDGRITLGANCYISTSTFAGDAVNVARIRPDGTLDRQFGNSGRVDQLYSYFSRQSVVQSTGKIVYGGNTGSQSPSGASFFLARYLDNGTREFDLDRDKKADLTVFRPSEGNWYTNGSATGFAVRRFGTSGDTIVPADYDGDGIVDVAVYRQGIWYVLKSLSNSFAVYSFGLSSDLPIAADYSGDGRADLAIFRDGDWYFYDPASGQSSFVHFGLSGDRPIAGNFDGDLRFDPAVYRNGTWYSLDSSTGFSARNFGLSNDKPVAADYDGDGITDLAVYRQGVWYILGSHSGFSVRNFGLATDRPVPADYDGDGRTDIAVYRDGTWYLQRSTAGFAVEQFGLASDIPVQSAYLR